MPALQYHPCRTLGPRKLAGRRTAVLALAAGLLLGCAEDIERTGRLGGPGADLDAARIEAFAQNESDALNGLAVAAGVRPSDLASTGSHWGQIVGAGINYVDYECDQYIQSLFWFDRAKNAARDEIALIGAATAGILGIAEAAADAIAITAISFGLVTASIDNLTASVLYEIDPSAVRSMLEQTQAKYRERLAGITYSNRPGAMAAIRGYLALCLPASLETQITEAITNVRLDSSVDVADSGKAENTAPVITVTPSGSEPEDRVIQFQGFTTAVQSLEDAVTDGRLDLRDPRMRACMTQEGVPESTIILDFILDQSQADVHQRVAACLGL